ncbi:MAG: helix-turn-helix domain-containing protein [Polyangiaceae bacterium]|nr:helix-turn-helix domain-containing protein [Polyangiaceae bacterium]
MTAPVAVVVLTPAQLRALLDEAVAPVLEQLTARGPEPLLDTEGACLLLGCSPPTLRKLRAEGLPVVMVGDAPRFERDAVLAWLRARGAT